MLGRLLKKMAETLFTAVNELDARTVEKTVHSDQSRQIRQSAGRVKDEPACHAPAEQNDAVRVNSGIGRGEGGGVQNVTHLFIQVDTPARSLTVAEPPIIKAETDPTTISQDSRKAGRVNPHQSRKARTGNDQRMFAMTIQIIGEKETALQLQTVAVEWLWLKLHGVKVDPEAGGRDKLNAVTAVGKIHLAAGHLGGGLDRLPRFELDAQGAEKPIAATAL